MLSDCMSTNFKAIILQVKKLITNILINNCPTLKDGEFKHEVRQFEKSYDNQQAEQISLMV